ncbi:hypothetical protein FG386_003414 [Cryptosporidium ryanae]|uniref:uncharacterized protein n=1 Tax=Cryptosporidium ryanae TaxID=515981 RepID=UPI00351A8698|nr:hypothetical protein FG386_003414 [Cryptosporidium ryanae]
MEADSIEESGVNLCINLDEYSICEICNFDFGPILIKKDKYESHLYNVHGYTCDETQNSNLNSESNGGSVLCEYYSLENVSRIRNETDTTRQKEYCELNGKDLSLIEVTETLRAAVKIFLNAFKRKIAYLKFPNTDILNLTEDQLNKLLSVDHGMYFFYSLINIGNVKDITVQSLIARSWDWSQEDQDLRKDLDLIEGRIINDVRHPHHDEANECINMGYLVLLTMAESVKHLLLLSYLTRTIFKRQE